MTIEKVETNELFETFIEAEQVKYEEKHGMVCNYITVLFRCKD